MYGICYFSISPYFPISAKCQNAEDVRRYINIDADEAA